MRYLATILSLTLILAALLFNPGSFVHAATHPRVLYNSREIDDLRTRINQGEQPLATHYQTLKNRASNAGSADVYTGKDPKYLREKLDKDVRSMYYHALRATIDNDNSSAKSARDLLASWAANSLTNVNAYSDFSDESGNQVDAAMFLSIAMFHAVPAYDLIYQNPAFSDADRTLINSWFRKIATLINQGVNNWFTTDTLPSCHHISNHVTADYTAMLLIGYLLDDQNLINSTLNGDGLPLSWYSLLEKSIYLDNESVIGCDATLTPNTFAGEIVDRYRHHDQPGSDPALRLNRGLGYSILSTYNLSLAAEAAYHNGRDLYHHIASAGESLRLPARYYSYYPSVFGPNNQLMTTTTYPGSAHYDNEMYQSDYLGAFELLSYRYASDQDIARAFTKYSLNNRPYYDNSLFGKIYRPNFVSWDFHLDSITEGWSGDNVSSLGGSLKFNNNSGSATITSPPLNLNTANYPILTLRLKATADGASNRLILGWGSNRVTNKVLSQDFTYNPDGNWHEYTLNLNDNPDWSGTINRLSLGLTSRANQNTFVEVDWIRLSSIAAAPPPSKPGDLNGDGSVNLLDYNVLIGSFGTKYTILHFNQILANWGK